MSISAPSQAGFVTVVSLQADSGVPAAVLLIFSKCGVDFDTVAGWICDDGVAASRFGRCVFLSCGFEEVEGTRAFLPSIEIGRRGTRMPGLARACSLLARCERWREQARSSFYNTLPGRNTIGGLRIYMFLLCRFWEAGGRRSSISHIKLQYFRL